MGGAWQRGRAELRSRLLKKPTEEVVAGVRSALANGVG